jgi:peptide subunit release factor 1 (eRF1)
MVRIASPFSSSPAVGRETAPATEVGQEGVSQLVGHLTSFDSQGHWVVSCYLKLEPRDRGGAKYLIKLKNRIRSRIAWAEQQGIERAEREAIGRDLERIREHLEDPGSLPAGRGIAMFACEPLGLMTAVPLPQVFRSRLVVDRTPLVRELAAVAGEFGLVYGAVYDRTSARFFRVSAYGAEELRGIAAGDASRTHHFHASGVSAGPGRGMASSGEYHHHQRIREEKQRHYALIAQELFDLSRSGDLRGVVLIGIGAETGAVIPYLHPYLQRVVLGTARLQPKTATAAEVQRVVLEVRRKAERSEEERLVNELREKRGAGWAVDGIETTLRALSRGQVRTLLVDPAASASGFRCGDSGRLTTSGRDCDGAPQPVEDVIDEALEDALRQRSHVDVIETPELRSKIDGLAALLRFKTR